MPTQSVRNHGAFGQQPHIVVVGAGAMGCYFGGMLMKAGHQVTFVDVNSEQIATINQRGVILETDDGLYEMPAKAALAKDVNRSADLVVLFTKTMHTMSAMESIRHILTDNTVVLSLQNGLGNAERVGQFVNPDRIVVGTTLVPADLKGAGHVASHGPSSSHIMDSTLNNPVWLTDLSEMFNEASLTTSIDPEIMTVIWSKVAFNAALNAICSITGSSPGGLTPAPAFKALARNVVHETVVTGQANGVSLDESYIWNNVEMAMREHPNHKPSMLQDIEAARATEIDAINGAIVAAAEKVGLDAPVNRTLAQLVKLSEQVAKNKKA
ncbi:ketopantoate reductase family protein [Marinomonas spartinae]|uniref:ketopantoate reductase family protein n=1 Tax=Marinomonas spartinae TaxID=1792290 RepID=UPI0018F223B5|nr:2-dehydropantoate 2-reductase [Marinomonas spartinae]MBJ7556809.1 2-dehydropantoate 2-reductase [Marinomonas spartinae]